MSLNKNIPAKENNIFEKHKSTFEILNSLEDDLKNRSSYPKYPFGINQIDKLIWGFHKKELLIFGARPSHGKTSLSLQGAWNLAKIEVPTIFVSLEMSKENILERICCNEYEIHAWKLRQGSKEEIEKFEKASLRIRAQLLKYPFEIIDYAGRTIQEIEEIINHFNPEFIFIDHAQKISSRGYGSKYEALSDYVNKLQDLAIKHNCGVILNSQINRGGEFLKGSGELEESSDTLVYLNWTCREKEDYQDQNEYEFSVQKQRHGPCDYTKIHFDANCFKFSDSKLF